MDDQVQNILKKNGNKTTDKNIISKKTERHRDTVPLTVDDYKRQQHSDIDEIQDNCYASLEKLRLAKRVVKEAVSFQWPTLKASVEVEEKQHLFWDTQPVPKINESITCSGPIEPNKCEAEIRQTPYSLPEGFRWDTLNLNEPIILQELYTLLNENYVEDNDSMFRFDYPPEFLKWALQPPNWRRDWHCGVRVMKNNRLVGFISAIPVKLRVYKQSLSMVEINFLCVHKKLRCKRVAPVLIREITRRANLCGIFQAMYTAGVILPKPVGTCRYWHRSLNPKKLIEVKFSHLKRNMTMQRTLKLYRLPELTKTQGLRKLIAADVPHVQRLLNEYLARFDLAPVFSREECCHWFLPRPGVIDSFVVEKNKKITDFVSYYSLPSTVMHHSTHKILKAAYSFYNVSSETPWLELMTDALVTAKNNGFDVFNALNIMENNQFLEALKFGEGDGKLQYYLYNWRCPPMDPNRIGLVLQ